MSEQNTFKVVKLSGEPNPTQVQQFVAMMQRMYDFHATLHTDWKTRPNWQEGSLNWIKRAGNNDDFFFAMAYPTTGLETEPAGYIIASFHYEAPLFIQNRFGYVSDLWVEESYRRQQAAQALLDAAYAWFRKQGVTRVQLEVDIENKAGQAFWQKAGYSNFELVMRKDI